MARLLEHTWVRLISNFDRTSYFSSRIATAPSDVPTASLLMFESRVMYTIEAPRARDKGSDKVVAWVGVSCDNKLVACKIEMCPLAVRHLSILQIVTTGKYTHHMRQLNVPRPG